MHSYFKGLLFDNDGVLLDSMPGALEAWKRWGDKYHAGFELLPKDFGQRASDIVLRMVGELLFEEANDYINRLELEMAHLTLPIPGAHELTSSLKAGTWTIVTGANPDLASARLEAAGIPKPKEIVTAKDCQNGKPHPEPFLRGAENLGLDISDCVVFEDAPSGIQSGKDGGAGLLVGVGQHMLPTDADIVVKDLTGITFQNGELFIPDRIRLR